MLLVIILKSLPNGINGCLMLLQIPIDLEKCATLVDAYTPTLGSADVSIVKAYSNIIKPNSQSGYFFFL